MRRMFAAFAFRNYRLWFVGQVVSLFGTWMQSTALGYFIFELTHSTAYLGYFAFISGIPTWLFMLYGGVASDRMSRRKLLLLTQLTRMLTASILTLYTFMGWIRVEYILVMAFIIGIANAFDAPARNAFVVELVDREHLTNAVALNSMMFNAGTAVGPAISGIVYAFFGPAWCFLINTLSFIALIIALLAMEIAPRTKNHFGRTMKAQLWDGLGFVMRHSVIRILIALILINTLCGFSYVTLIPAWAKTVLGGDAKTNGLLQSARGLGSLVGALAIAYLGQTGARGKFLLGGMFLFPIMLLGFSMARWVPLSLLMQLGIGIGLILIFNLSNALVQTQVPDEFRGRVMGVYTLAFFGFWPIGGLLMGAAADLIGEPITVGGNAIVLLAAATVIFGLFPALRALK